MSWEDHPRMRGEHVGVLLRLALLVGSSPHARGALMRGVAYGCRMGIIPACAGSTRCIAAKVCEVGDHPRMRGEHENAQLVSVANVGSSPHARGAHSVISPPDTVTGIIPACAGSTAGADCKRQASWDHPRMRGEHIRPSSAEVVESGSSPHARGARGRRF